MPKTIFKMHGGKSYLAAWLYELSPPSVWEDRDRGYTHRTIAFAGGLNEILSAQANWPVDGISESVNDLNSELSTFWRCLGSAALRDRLITDLQLTPFSQVTWEESRRESMDPEQLSDPVYIAKNFFIRLRQSRQAVGKCYATPTTRTRRGMHEHVSAWLTAVDGLMEVSQRLLRVEVRCMDFEYFLLTYDHARAFHYLDPPYHPDTRAKNSCEYGEFEMDVPAHERLLQVLSCLNGKWMLSGYHTPLYDEWAKKNDYHCFEKVIDAKSSSKKVKDTRIECVWRNY